MSSFQRVFRGTSICSCVTTVLFGGQMDNELYRKLIVLFSQFFVCFLFAQRIY